MDPLTLLTVFAPLVMDGTKALIGRFTGGKPAVLTTEDYARTLDADTRRLEALAKLDVPAGDVSRWVNDVRAMQRPVVVAVVLLAWGFVVLTGASQLELVSNLASSVFFYLFGERGLMYLKRK